MSKSARHFFGALMYAGVLAATLHWGVAIAIGWFIGEIICGVIFGFVEA
jgi:hypothetical protein